MKKGSLNKEKLLQENPSLREENIKLKYEKNAHLHKQSVTKK
jgi:hypothetical protein